MLRIAIVTAVLSCVVPAHAQNHGPQGPRGAGHGAHHGHGAAHGAASPVAGSALPSETGQAAFAAIAEIVRILEADPRTDWSSVDIEALRIHLADMHRVTVEAVVAVEPVEAGLRFSVTGSGPVRDSIRRMVLAHAATMNGVGGWGYSAAEISDGAALTVTVPVADLPRLRGLGFIGVMTRGMHHQEHHLMIARGTHPHR